MDRIHSRVRTTRVRRFVPVIAALQLAALTTTALSATLVGNTSGSFDVSRDGNAAYRLDLTLTSGTTRMQPALALVYSSGAGDGIAGWGWSVSGFSSIQRRQATYAQNNRAGSISYDNNDRRERRGERDLRVPCAPARPPSDYARKDETRKTSPLACSS